MVLYYTHVDMQRILHNPYIYIYIYIYIYLVLEELSTVQVFTLFVSLTMNPSAAMELS